MNVYKETTVSNHPKIRPNGCVHDHILVAEKILGRYLKDGETVHHKDENKHNNSENNIMVFETSSDHSRFHSGVYDDIIEIEPNIWTCIKKEFNQIACPKCGSIFTPIYKDQMYCSDLCRRLDSRRCDRPTKDELFELIKSKSFVGIGKIYGVSDNAVKKWCKYYDLPYRKKDL